MTDQRLGEQMSHTRFSLNTPLSEPRAVNPLVDWRYLVTVFELMECLRALISA